MKNALSFDIEDWFQVENLKSEISRAQWDHLEFRADTSTRKILSILREADVKATFFILGWVAEKCPELVREIAKEGHEVASHGYGHELVYDQTVKQFRCDLVKSKEILEELSGQRIKGYRAPSFSITKDVLWAIDVLKEEGFLYDSSIFPVTFHDRYGFSGTSTIPFRWPNGLHEVPLAVYKLRNFSLPTAGGGYFRLFPYQYFKYFLKRINTRKQAFTFYLHPWELDPGQPRVKPSLQYRFRHYVCLGRTEKRLRRLVDDFDFDSIVSAHQLESG